MKVRGREKEYKISIPLNLEDEWDRKIFQLIRQMPAGYASSMIKMQVLNWLEEVPKGLLTGNITDNFDGILEEVVSETVSYKETPLENSGSTAVSQKEAPVERIDLTFDDDEYYEEVGVKGLKKRNVSDDYKSSVLEPFLKQVEGQK